MEQTITVIFLVIIAALTVLHLWVHKTRLGKYIDRVPGPSTWPILGNLLDVVVPPESLWLLFRRCADQYYPIYKLWIGHWPVVILRHPDDAEVLLTSQKNITKSLFYDFLRPWLNDGLLTSTGNKWRGRRKTLTPSFHFNVLQDSVQIFAENSERMVETLKQDREGVIKDLVSFFATFTLNTICETTMGTSLQKNDPEQSKYRNGVKRMGDMTYYRSVRPWLVNDWIFSWTKMGREQKEALERLHGFTDKIIKNRQKYHDENGGKYLKIFSSENEGDDKIIDPDYEVPVQKKRLAMLDLLISAQKEGKDMDDLAIREEVDTFVFEGHDTTDMGLCFALLLLAEHKEIQARARAEIDSVLKDSGGKLGVKELQNLSYLDRCIKESLRLFPSVPAISRELTHDMYLKKLLVPRGTIVNLHIFDVHRDPNFWPQPHVYDPDRFLPERAENRHPFSYIPFSGGPRNCIGQKFAVLEMKVFIGLLLHNFYFEPMMQVASVRMLPDLVLRSLQPLKVKFIPIR